jgi:hypothetical protein
MKDFNNWNTEKKTWVPHQFLIIQNKIIYLIKP